MIRQRDIELLAPAKNLECGIAAIDHGADAVYIGAPRFGARASAGNSVNDIRTLADYAHIFGARIYVTVNTILRDDELADTEQMIWQLYEVGVDALIVQDMAVTRMKLPPIALHASTQMDNRTAEKVKFLADAGFTQVVLARELSLEDISEIHRAVPNTPLEIFVHGALCVSYSGQCYVSEACYGRSANRGECAQFCRLSFNMEDADGQLIARDKHLLSLKDLNQSNRLEQLLDAGASSLKIEGRLKDVTYVKNVVAYYRRQLDQLFKRRKEYRRASSGKVTTDFQPQLDKSFNRGFTHYFLEGRTSDIFSFDTPKSLGEEMGLVKEVRGNSFTIAGVKPFNNGDGLCYIDNIGRLQGFRVNRVDGNRLFPQEMPARLLPRTKIYRNFDQKFEQQLSRKSAERRIQVEALLGETPFGFSLTLKDEDDVSVSIAVEYKKEQARTPQKENLRKQLSKLGNTPFELIDLQIEWTDNWFVPSSVVGEWRRQVVELLLSARRINHRRPSVVIGKSTLSFPQKTLTYMGNVMNREAEAFYRAHGVTDIKPAFEINKPEGEQVVMTCRHCLRYSMGWCPVHHRKPSPYREPYYIVSGDGRRFRLEFDCKHCQMKVWGKG
ncbi:MAG: U32 family peptidase [Bacteroidaceae bacterium]|nr:U32 family peptidase [Bacteroidaceae bacterium]